MEAAKQGVAVIIIGSTPFLPLARAQLKALGGPEIPIAEIPHPFSTIGRDEVRRVAEDCIERISRLALGNTDSTPAAHGEGCDTARTNGASRVREITMPEDVVAFNRECELRRWTDGLPAIPPLRRRVEWMLSGTRRTPGETIARVAPGFGVASVERIAVNAVMAGCRPEHFPVLIAVVEAVTDRAFNIQGIQATTGPATPWIVVNGPLAARLGFNAGTNCLGQGRWANATLGRALRLVLQNIGGAFPAEMDHATQGQPGKYTFCCAENEAESPWQPLHAERGFALHESVVTVIGAASTVDMNTHADTAEDLLRVMADTMTFPACNDYHFSGQPWLIVSPEHAAILNGGGLSKPAVKRQLWKRSKMKASRFAATDYERAAHTRRGELGPFTPDTRVPISASADDIGIVVAGGAGAHSVYVPSFGISRAVSRKIGN
ncbi:MAG: hypothetical protein HYY78_16535 [Betaproteobacteria bacterium]|nr:hypothetical protein [Betaproteobacteria bacterium]